MFRPDMHEFRATQKKVQELILTLKEKQYVLVLLVCFSSERCFIFLPVIYVLPMFLIFGIIFVGLSW